MSPAPNLPASATPDFRRSSSRVHSSRSLRCEMLGRNIDCRPVRPAGAVPHGLGPRDPRVFQLLRASSKDRPVRPQAAIWSAHAFAFGGMSGPQRAMQSRESPRHAPALRQVLRPHKAQMHSRLLTVRQSFGPPGIRVLGAGVVAAVVLESM